MSPPKSFCNPEACETYDIAFFLPCIPSNLRYVDSESLTLCLCALVLKFGFLFSLDGYYVSEHSAISIRSLCFLSVCLCVPFFLFVANDVTLISFSPSCRCQAKNVLRVNFPLIILPISVLLASCQRQIWSYNHVEIKYRVFDTLNFQFR